MNKWEKQVQRALIKDEQRILRILQLMYNDVLRETQDKIAVFFTRVTANPSDAAAVYQLRYQQALAQQLSDILDGFEDKNYTSIQSYLEDCYTNGFVGAMYDIHRQGIPVVAPIQQENVVRAITTDSKISVPMYTRLGNNIAQLKTAIAAEVTRGIASGHSWHDTAAGIARQGQVSAYNAMRIARTEGHRIACEAQVDGCQEAKAAGADVVKQWSAAHDERTREHHRLLDGQLRELDDPFEVAGIKVQYPGNFGRPEEDIHCRCALLQRARWALSEEELEKLRNTSAARELAGIEDFGEFKGKYLELTENSADVSTEFSDKTVDNSAESGIIKNIELPPETDGIRSMSAETRDMISDAFDKVMSEYDVHVDRVVTIPLKPEEKNVPFQFQPIRGDNGELIKQVAINSGYDFMGSQEEFQARIMRNYNSRVLASNSIEGLVAHELAHVMTFQDVMTFTGYLIANKSVSERFVGGISRYADASGDGAECIAEAFAAKVCGQSISDEAEALVTEFVERWRKNSE